MNEREKKDLLEILDDVNEEMYISDYCDKAKNIFISYMINKFYYSLNDDTLCSCDCSPIEQIFEVAYRLYMLDFHDFNDNIEELEKVLPLPIHALFNEELEKQKEIVCNEKKYIADFAIDLSKKSLLKDEYIYPSFHNLKYIIELDGYEYHSDRKQVNYDYERERDLQELGYKVIRFTGSQIYNKPFSNIDKLVNIILNDMRRNIKDGNI